MDTIKNLKIVIIGAGHTPSHINIIAADNPKAWED